MPVFVTVNIYKNVSSPNKFILKHTTNVVRQTQNNFCYYLTMK